MIDLHCHTKISDNSMPAVEILQLAKKKGIQTLAITDHDTTKGLREAVTEGQKLGIEVIPGIELSAYDYKRNKRAHILGFFIEPGHASLENLCRPLVEKRHEASRQMVERIIGAGYDISWTEVEKHAEGGTGVYKQHIMHALLDKGYCERIYCDLYRELFKRGNSPESQGLAYIPLEYLDAVLAIKAVREAGGVAVIAHPGQLGNFDAIGEWAEAGLEGIEVFHESHSDEDLKKSLELAEKFNLVITGGSDFHGFYGETPVELGCRELCDACVQELKDRSMMNRNR